MKILFIAPIPPPINGQSKASKVLLDKLQEENNVEIVNLSKSSLKNGVNSLNRFSEIFNILKNVRKKRKNNDIIYLSLAESFAGNMRDLLIYFICRKYLNKTYIQMLGGAGMKEILTGTSWQRNLNATFMKKIAGVIIEGPINYDSFRTVFSHNKIHIVPNFAEDFLFVSNEEIEKKFSHVEPIEVLYLSNLIPGKGYNELADAYLLLNNEEQNMINLSFVGGFENAESEGEFMKKIATNKHIKYLGKFIDGKSKRELYLKSHVFCLPTYYPFEGQPISILEGYATGCAVVTSNHSGIPFIFKDELNGFMVEKKSVQSLVEVLRKLILQKNSLKKIALYNKDQAFRKYRTEIYQDKILNILKNSFNKE